MNGDDRRRSAELLKDLIVEDRRSVWPKIFGVAVVLLLVGGAAYWFHLPPDQRPALSTVRDRLGSLVHTLMNTPVLGSSSAPAAANPEKPAAAAPAKDTGLLSN